MNEVVILSHLLDKYERSKHLFQPSEAGRGVMLKVGPGKKDFPEYDYENASVRDAWNTSAIHLEQEGLIQNEWVKGRPVLSCIRLNLNRVMDCYRLVGRVHPKELAMQVASIVNERLENASTCWIVAWRNQICSDAQSEYSVPAYCKEGLSPLEDLLKAMACYDAMHGESTTMRAFSSKCFHDTKYFERNVRDLFLRIAQKYDVGLSQMSAQESLGTREQLAYLGIYARPELYELAGDIVVYTKNGSIHFSAAMPYGLALPSTSINQIVSIGLTRIQKIVFIENKTNYDEYILSELTHDTLAVYHGGFLSPQKKKLFQKLGEAVQTNCDVFFWADIDLGGFQMFAQLQQLIPSLKPLRMSGSDVDKYHTTGLTRSASYLNDLKSALKHQEYPLFTEAIQEILKYGVTIEQEVFLYL